MKKLLLFGLFVAGLVIGSAFGSWWTARVYTRLAMRNVVEAASIAAFQAEWLARLRLGETEGAITDIENAMDIQLSNIAAWNESSLLDEKTRKARDRWLVPVKLYHQSYPVTGGDVARINSLLATIPDRKTNSLCKGGICRLDDRRLSLNATNAAK